MEKNKWIIYAIFSNNSEKMQEWRTKALRPVAQRLIAIGLRANHLTALGFLCGVLAIYFLFEKHTWFVVFGLLHLCIDAIDGVVARLTEPTKIGKYLDYLSDRMIEVALLLKSYFVLQEFPILIVAFLILLGNIAYLVSKMRYPIYFGRTMPLLLFMVKLYVIGILYAGVIALYSLAMQLNEFVKRMMMKTH